METVERMALSQWSLLDTCMCLSVRDWWLLWTGLLHECPFNGQDWQDFERGQIFVLPAWQKLFDARLILEPEQAAWFLVAGSCHTAASATKALPNRRSEVSSKLKLSQLSRLRRRHSSLIWPFAQMKTVERIDLSQWSLLDTCMCSLFGTGDYCGLDCCTNAHSIGRPGKTLNESKCSFFQHGQKLFDARLILEPAKAMWFLVAASNKIRGSLSHSSIRNKTIFPPQGLSCLPSSVFNIAKETLFIDLSLCKNGNCGENGSLTVVTAWHLHVLSVRYWWLLWTGLLHECPFNWQDWQDIEREQMFVLPAWQKLFDARLILEPEQATWFLVAGINRRPSLLMRVVHWFFAYAVYVARAAAGASNMWFWWTVFLLHLQFTRVVLGVLIFLELLNRLLHCL